MATTGVTVGPIVDQLPTAPNRGMSSSVYPVVADTWAAKIGPWTTQLNAVTVWMGQVVDATFTARDAAAASASAAANSAITAGLKVTAAAEQVALAVAAKEAAAASANSAQISAAAAGAAAGLPALAGHAGQSMVVKQDESGFELKSLGQAIGDVLETTRTPDATYLLPDTIYTRAAYPDLFAIIGTQGEKNDGGNFLLRPHGVALFAYMGAAQGNGVIIAVGYNTNGGEGQTGYSNSMAVRSTDSGLTWAPIAALANGPALSDIDTDNNGVWCAMDRAGAVVRSTDNGLTWSSRAGTGATISVSTMVIRCNRKGVWLATGFMDTNYIQIGRSVNNGVSWTPIDYTATGAFSSYISGFYADYVTGDFWVRSNSYYLARSTTAGDPAIASSVATVKWISAFSNGTASSVSHVAINAGVVAFMFGPTLYISLDAGVTYKGVLGIPQGIVMVDPFGVILISSSQRYYRSYDYGETFTVTTQSVLSVSAADPVGRYSVMYDAASGIWNLGASSQNFYRATRQYNYDVATQFKTPAHKAPKGYKAYIKGKLL